MRILAYIAIVLVSLLLVSFKIRAAMSENKTISRFAPCPSSPNCVSSRAPRDSQAWIEPYSYQKPVEEAKVQLINTVSRVPRVQLVSNDGPYLHFEFKSFLFRFIDDVEFEFDEITKTVQIRSASRVGHSDLGVNRKRMEEIRAAVSGQL